MTIVWNFNNKERDLKPHRWFNKKKPLVVLTLPEVAFLCNEPEEKKPPWVKNQVAFWKITNKSHLEGIRIGCFLCKESGKKDTSGVLKQQVAFFVEPPWRL